MVFNLTINGCVNRALDTFSTCGICAFSIFHQMKILKIKKNNENEFNHYGYLQNGVIYKKR